MLKITKGKLLQDDLTSSWRHLQYWNMKSFRRIVIQAIHISTINFWHVLFITFVIYIYIVLCASVFDKCYVRNDDILGFFCGILVFMLAYLFTNLVI